MILLQELTASTADRLTTARHERQWGFRKDTILEFRNSALQR